MMTFCFTYGRRKMLHNVFILTLRLNPAYYVQYRPLTAGKDHPCLTLFSPMAGRAGNFIPEADFNQRGDNRPLGFRGG